MKIFAILTVVALSAAALLVAAPDGFPLRAMLFAAQDAGQKTPPKAAKQPKKKTDGKQGNELTAEEIAARQKAALFAGFLLKSCREKLKDDAVATYHAEIEEQVRIGDRTFAARGNYWKGTGLRFRLELNMVIGEGKDAVKARMLQVCDGEILMTERVMGNKKRYTRRNVKQILAAATNAVQLPQNELIAEFGLGGIRGMIASLERTMLFDTPRKTIPTKGKHAIQIEGTWNEANTAHWINWMQQTRQRQLPAHVPNRVRVLVDSDYYLRKIEYLRTAPDGKTLNPLLTINFLKIVLNPKLDEQKLFQYVSEPGVFVKDTTARYIQMFQPAAAKR